MLTLTIPQGNAFFQQRVELEGRSYVLDFAWVERAGVWHLSYLTDDGAPIVHGVAIVTNRPLIGRYRYRGGLPPGELFFFDPTNRIAAPGYDQLTELLYAESTELP